MGWTIVLGDKTFAIVLGIDIVHTKFRAVVQSVNYAYISLDLCAEYFLNRTHFFVY